MIEKKSGRLRWRAATAATLIVGVLLTAGCSGRGAGESPGTESGGEGATVESFAIVTPEKESDYGWNQQGIRSARSAAEQLGIELEEHTNVGYDNTETILTQVADSGVDFIIAHASGFNTPDSASPWRPASPPSSSTSTRTSRARWAPSSRRRRKAPTSRASPPR
ncbi:type 1 periplasmic-binding domain-containing protein [Leucobacter soli]|uniref:hypothetical protein n=1 Tax=Leucobacter soli TaxID=2812850 RepID=UPI00360E8343